MHGMSMPLILPTTATSQSLEQRLEQAGDLVRRVFRVSRLLSSSATKKVFGPYRSKNCDSMSRHAASSMAAQAETAPTSQHRAGARIGNLIPLRPLAVAARSSTLQPCSQSISSTESTASKSAGSQPMSPGSTSNTLELPAARQVMPICVGMAGNVANFYSTLAVLIFCKE